MKESKTVDDLSAKTNNIMSNILTLGDTMDEAYVVKKFLRCVPLKFLQIKSTIEQFANLDTIFVEEVTESLKCYEERICGNVEHEEQDEKKFLLTH